jgi:hypothetical protein
LAFCTPVSTVAAEADIFRAIASRGVVTRIPFAPSHPDAARAPPPPTPPTPRARRICPHRRRTRAVGRRRRR